VKVRVVPVGPRRLGPTYTIAHQARVCFTSL
jgi:hypothetical protein